MTLLITAVGPEYSLCVSDQRTTSTYLGRTRIIEERFNKHIYFGTEEYVGNISYTGVAQWRLKGVRYRLYDLISEAIASIIETKPSLSALCLHIIQHLQDNIPDASVLKVEPDFELHIVTRHKAVPVNSITVISTFRTAPPWGSEDGTIYEWTLGPVTLFMKVLIEESEVIFGGMDPRVSVAEKARLRDAVRAGANAFQASQLASKIVENVSLRTPTVGPTSVAISIPANGYMDTNLWSKSDDAIVGFVPRMIYPNGVMMGPSQFPVDLSIVSAGQHPRHSLFFKTIVFKLNKKRITRLIFRRRKGPLIPGIMGLIGLMFYGKVMDGYEDFGLGNSTKE